jgi:hypothetical protein
MGLDAWVAIGIAVSLFATAVLVWWAIHKTGDPVEKAAEVAEERVKNLEEQLVCLKKQKTGLRPCQCGGRGGWMAGDAIRGARYVKCPCNGSGLIEYDLQPEIAMLEHQLDEARRKARELRTRIVLR